MDEPPNAGMVLDKAQLAEWMGYDSPVQMDAEHDLIHSKLCIAFAAPSLSLRAAQGETLSDQEKELALFEEAAVLYVQRWQRRLKQWS